VKELNKREKIIVSIFTVIFVAFLVNRFVLEPQNKKMKQLRKELASLSEQTASIGPKLVEFNRLKSDLIRKKKRLAAVEQALSQTAETAEVIHKVSTQARSNGLQIQQIRPQKETLLSDFLAGLEQQPFYVKVAELHVSKREKREQRLEIQLKLEIVVRS
jgi:Tfp pilus assembly protein PilO